MSTEYFILSREKGGNVMNNSTDSTFCLDKRLNFILPKNLYSCYADNGLFESSLIEWCKQFCHDDKVVLDIGAHTGSYAISLARHAKHIHAFEPQRMTYYSLCGGVSLSGIRNVTCHNIGLGSQSQVGKQRLHIVSNDGGGSSIQEQKEESILAHEDIEVATLDSLAINNISFVKIDVEDNELSVLHGATETLERSNYPPIMFECNDVTKHADLWSFIQSLSYNIITIGGVQNMYLATKQ
jgi:FkbM family methyltransferase